MPSLPTRASVSDRFRAGLLALREQADARIFWVLLAQWTVTLFTSVTVASQSDHPRLDLLSTLVVAVGLLSILQLAMILKWPGTAQTRWTIVGAEAVIFSLVWCASQGRPETHLHLFAWLIVLAMYRDLPALLTTVLAAVTGHLMMIATGLLPALPIADSSQLATYLIWLAWMVGETAFLATFVLLDRQSLALQAEREYSLELLQDDFQQKFDGVTEQLVQERDELRREVAKLTERRQNLEASQRQSAQELLALRKDFATAGTAILKLTSRQADTTLSKSWQSQWQAVRQQAQHLMRLIDLPSLEPETAVRKPKSAKLGGEERLELAPVEIDKRAMLLMRNPLQQAKAVTALEREGYKVDVVPNGPRTYYSVMLNDYSVIVVDIDLPEEEGFDTLEALQLLPAECIGRSKMVFAMTNDKTQENILRCAELGVDNVFLKPLQADALRDSLAQKAVVQPARSENASRKDGSGSALLRST